MRITPDTVVLDGAPLSLLPVEIARQVRITRYVWVGTAAVFIWDILNNLSEDYMLLSKYRLRWPVVAYFVSRITCAVYVIGFTIFLTYPVGGCGALDLALNILYPFAIPSTSLLFFFRVRAVYGAARRVTIIFGLLWIAELAACVSVPFGTGGINIGPTRYCIVTKLEPFAGSAAITPAVFDTSVFIAISYRLVGNTHVEYSWGQALRALLTGAYLPSFSKSLLIDGQMYYMITVVGNIVTAIMVYFPGIEVGYRSLPVIPTMTLTSVMACRVYRHTRLDLAQRQSFIWPTSRPTEPRSLHIVYPRRQTRAVTESRLEDSGEDISQENNGAGRSSLKNTQLT
ncbi:hypothetical protein B0H12DRAFT_1035933 [Mycena haematopus]|nr:hypothetical protein B0H12DRAFT_1035933 [Mycena haematopus]